MLEDREPIGLLLKVVNRLDKLENSPVLGAETITKIDLLTKDMSEIETKVAKLTDPETGIYTRILKIENTLESINKLISQFDKKFEIPAEKKEEIKEQKELNEITKQLKIIGGKDLEKIKNTIDFHENFSKLLWIVFGGFTLQIINLIMTVLRK
jgi:uncharacterized coiled-coil DUF342 family protein